MAASRLFAPKLLLGVILPLRVETTHLRAAAYGHRTVDGGFSAMNPKSCRSHPDPEASSRLPRSLRSGASGLSAFRHYIASVCDLTAPARSCLSFPAQSCNSLMISRKLSDSHRSQGPANRGLQWLATHHLRSADDNPILRGTRRFHAQSLGA